MRNSNGPRRRVRSRRFSFCLLASTAVYLGLASFAAWAQARPATDPNANLPAQRIGANDLIADLGL